MSKFNKNTCVFDWNGNVYADKNDTWMKKEKKNINSDKRIDIRAEDTLSLISQI